ncbi:MscS Mechanosensitive ion channel [Rippkaea orientalis PCC 8801]|uniref:MscS Mechanosensitive ion channel n=1 Tax=Rippkaea orientalis (strain PCC 8801 / RF-1) TaxID=41431 RepID=B7JXR3_RIPO1|nr:mechanosensitive ion channel domain-containing protein [Rippkaea orientalis]ACK64820.1 MscS Mechanosensitive ion channel [Rippkaea orientalis PCC 8801]
MPNSISWSIIQAWFSQTLTTPLFTIGVENISLLWIIQVIVLLIIVSIIARAIKRFLKEYLLAFLKISEGNREVIGTLSGLGLGTLGYIIVLQGMGLDLASLAVIVGGFGVGIGFGLQELTKNLVSGLTLLAESKLKVGDLIEFQGELGYIQEISIRSTVIRTFQGSQLVVPNTDLTSKTVENWNYENCQGRVDIAISVAYDSDPLLVTEVLLESAFMEPEVLTSPPPKVIFMNYGENALSFELWVWVEHIDRRQVIKSSLNFIIEYNFRQRGIIMPFPQGELWLHSLDDLKSIAAEKQIQLKSTLTETLALTPTLKEFLQQFTCFKRLNDLELRGLVEMGSRRHLKMNDIWVRQGEYSDSFCIVLSGKINAIYETQKISNRLFTFDQGNYFGELPLLLEIPYPTTMIAATDSILFVLGKDCFQTLLNQCPHFAEDVAEELAKRQDVLQDYQQQLKKMGLMDEEDLKNPVAWIRQRLGQIFNLKL